MLGRRIDVTRRRNLPHWEADEGTYFVTFRLFDSLPGDLARLHGVKRVEEALDRGFGSAHLAKPEIGELVFGALRHFDQQRYTLHSACVMPNHVHTVLRTAHGVRLGDVTHAWKSFTANRANRLLGREGTFWQRESYDRLIRDAHEFERANAYVLANPDKAGLRDWKWVAPFDRDFRVVWASGLP